MSRSAEAAFLGTHQIPAKNGMRAYNGQLGKKRIPNAYQTHTKRIPNAYQTHTKRIPNAYQTHTKRIPNEYHTPTNCQAFFLVPQLRCASSLLETPFHGKIAIIFENLNRFGTPFQKVFCHSAKSHTPLAEYFSGYKTLKSRSE